VIEAVFKSCSDWIKQWIAAWNTFWFQEQLPHVLAVIRICCGAMIAYVHIIWVSRLTDFFGPNAWIDRQTAASIHSQDWAWSWLWFTDNTTLTLAHQILAIVAGLMMMAGLMTRFSIPLAWFLTLMVCHRQTLALFGLDQIVIMLSMYLMLSRCGSVWSIDSWLRERRGTSWLLPADSPAASNQIATRLIQLHLCVIYLFGGLSKMRGEMWFDGSALWYTIVNYEYQSLDLTWLGNSRITIASLTAATIFWETFYCGLVWPRLTRPLTLLMAVFVHGGIALALGMVTFGFIMIVANFSFVPPALLHRLPLSTSDQ
jgi:hypothetical protein